VLVMVGTAQSPAASTGSASCLILVVPEKCLFCFCLLAAAPAELLLVQQNRYTSLSNCPSARKASTRTFVIHRRWPLLRNARDSGRSRLVLLAAVIP
tara:strand:- start:3478 stop:3768 length:291 start_codon:yes stop_codon:yes gene_type:complete